MTAVHKRAAGYLLKSATFQEITEGIRTVMNGNAILDSSLASFILSTLKTKVPQADELASSLSKRELEVLNLLAEGRINKEISELLNIEKSTVKTHIKRIYLKLSVANAPAAVSKAYKTGILPNHEA